MAAGSWGWLSKFPAEMGGEKAMGLEHQKAALKSQDPSLLNATFTDVTQGSQTSGPQSQHP